MSLLITSLMHVLRDVATAKGLTKARVDRKVNRKGELVVAIIVPEAFPGQWADLARDRRTSDRG
jgi:hypothetical protein